MDKITLSIIASFMLRGSYHTEVASDKTIVEGLV